MIWNLELRRNYFNAQRCDKVGAGALKRIDGFIHLAMRSKDHNTVDCKIEVFLIRLIDKIDVLKVEAEI